MDERITRTIRNLANWEDLQQFEKNVLEKNRLSTDIADAISTRAADLGKKLISEKTGLDLTDLSPAEKKIVQVISEYISIMKREGKYPGRTLTQLRNRGLIDAAEVAVCGNRPTQGFQILADANLEDLTYEQIVVDHPDEFSPRALWFSRRTLKLPNEIDAPPAPTHGDTQTRTDKLIIWLKNRARNNNGLLAYTNDEAAVAMEISDMRKFGRHHGNIQSRIDFACYASGLPPLGLVVDSPFSGAWAKEDRDWEFPQHKMQAAAKSRIWNDMDFDTVLEKSRNLPAVGNKAWIEAFASESAKVKKWAFSMNETGSRG